MNPTPEYIKLCQKAEYVQKEWKPEVDDKVRWMNEDKAPWRLKPLSILILRNKDELEGKPRVRRDKNSKQSNYTFLPSVEWCLDKIRSKVHYVEVSAVARTHWRITINLININNYYDASRSDLNIAALIACEFVLSSGKNDLRKGDSDGK